MNMNNQIASNWSVFCIFLFPAFGGYLFGYDIGATSFVLTQLTGSHSGVKWGGEDNTVDNSAILQGIITSAAVGGALIGSCIIFLIADQLGRRKELIYGAFLYMIGSILEYISADNDFDSSLGITILLIGRIIYGIGCGFSMHGAPAYIAEMAPSHIRGILISLKECMIVFGILMGYLIGYLFQHDNGGWKYTYGISSIIALFMLLGNYLLPPSIRWLLLHKRIGEARKALSFIYKRPEDVEMILDELKDQAEEFSDRISSMDVNLSVDNYERKSLIKSNDSSWDRTVSTLSTDITPLNLNNNNNNNNDGIKFCGCCNQWVESMKYIFLQRFRPALIAGVGLVFLQQVTGQPSVLYYANSIFDDAGLASIATVAVGIFKLIATLISVVFVDKYGRKFLLFIGISMMSFALIILFIAFFQYDGGDDDDDDSNDDGNLSTWPIIIILAMFIYIGGYQVGFGPISWLIISEIFPLEVRGQALAFAVQTNFFWNLLVSLVFALEIEAIGTSATFGIFALISIYSIYFVYKHVPETKGLSLEEIEEFFRSNYQIKTEESLERPLLQDGV